MMSRADRSVSRDPLAASGFRYVARAARASVSHPRDGFEKLGEKLARRRELFVRGQEKPPEDFYQPDLEWERRLHELVGAAWPCEIAADFAPVWADVVETMAAKGLRVGRQNYGRDDDADPGLARAIWCLTRHLRPRHVVETGVAHGVTTRCVLEALQRNRAGRLWSIDLPPFTIVARRGEVAAAVPDDLRERWLYLRGSSRRRLPTLIDDLGEIDLFVHDSLHSTRNTLFELTRAWSALKPGGVAVADDLDGNWGFHEFSHWARDGRPLIGSADDGERCIGFMRKLPARELRTPHAAA
jgi:hypothetical protein